LAIVLWWQREKQKATPPVLDGAAFVARYKDACAIKAGVRVRFPVGAVVINGGQVCCKII